MLSRTEKGFWLSKVVGLSVALPFCLEENEENDLSRSMGFRLRNFSFDDALLWRETLNLWRETLTFPTRFEFYRVPISTHLRHEPFNYDT